MVFKAGGNIKHCARCMLDHVGLSPAAFLQLPLGESAHDDAKLMNVDPFVPGIMIVSRGVRYPEKKEVRSALLFDGRCSSR